MRRYLLQLVCCAMLTAGPASSGLAGSQVRTPPAPKIAVPIPIADLAGFVDGYVASAMAGAHVGGVSVAIVQGDRTLLAKGYGIAGLQPQKSVDPERTSFRIASLSKIFTWILLMKLVEDGKVDLAAPINTYLPADLRIPADGFTRPIRVIDLMDHSPGFEDTALGYLYARTPAQLISPREFMKRHRPRRVREPGLFSSYSNYGASLAGMIVEHVNGADIQTVAEREIFKPLGMDHTTFREPYPAHAGLPAPMPASLVPGISSPLVWAGGRFQQRAFEFITDGGAAGSASSTAADMARFMRMQLANGSLDGRRIYGPQTARAFRTPIFHATEGLNGWAHGLRQSTFPGGYRAYGHGGATLYFMTQIAVLPELKLGIFVTTNSPTGAALVTALPRAIVRRFYAPAIPAQPAGVPDIAAIAAPFLGTYIETRRAYAGLEKFANLVSWRSTVKADPRGYLIVTDTRGTRALVPEGPRGRFRDVASRDIIVFHDSSDGGNMSYDLPNGDMRFERAGPLFDTSLFTAAGIFAAAATACLLGLSGTFLARGWRTARRLRPLDGLAMTVALLSSTGFFLSYRWLAERDDVDELYHFPGALLSSLSAVALAGTIGAVMLIFFSLPLAIRRERLLLGYTTCAVPLVMLSIFLGAWGLLWPFA